MKKVSIEIIKSLNRERASIVIDRITKTLIFTMKNGKSSTHIASDLYICFGLIRSDFPDIKFLCKGAKINVHPSRMSSQMSAGLVAYEVRTGHPTDEEDIVRIFDYEENDLTNDIEEQKKHYQRWIDSIKATHQLPT
ncbi:hypothetical protein PSH79_16935 [Pseudomonas sp. FP2196]|uniref:hypothetical protein n=1 Tax=Pseudomonas sp. FP2196 TaxID=2954086 RepID=UPI00273472AE|nr:hypothetical protein [Pseudomonas sp. FP2196]WLH33616.1 hypothetical protein PSH79_16935 [Pseudomonas sp. FP2196]